MQINDTSGILTRQVWITPTAHSKYQTHNCKFIRSMNTTEDNLVASAAVETKQTPLRYNYGV